MVGILSGCNGMSTKRKDESVQSSALQRRTLYSLVRADPDLLAAKFRLDFTHRDAQQRWQKIATQLNSLPGAHKDWKHWRKAWQDHRTRTKRSESSDSNIKPNGEEHSSKLAPIEEFDVTNPNLHEFQMESEVDTDSSSRPLKRLSRRKKRHKIDRSDHKLDTTDHRVETSDHRLEPNVSRHEARDALDKDNILSADDNVRFIMQRELEIKSSYYERKLLLMERQVVALEKIANAAVALENPC